MKMPEFSIKNDTKTKKGMRFFRNSALHRFRHFSVVPLRDSLPCHRHRPTPLLKQCRNLASKTIRTGGSGKSKPHKHSTKPMISNLSKPALKGQFKLAQSEETLRAPANKVSDGLGKQSQRSFPRSLRGNWMVSTLESDPAKGDLNETTKTEEMRRAISPKLRFQPCPISKDRNSLDASTMSIFGLPDW
jgi:hypothetical protein